MRDGKIYVCDMRSASLVVLDLKKKEMRLVGVSGTNRLAHPVAVAVAEDGKIYVGDNERGAILAYDASERYVGAIGHTKFKPAGLAVHGDRLYATNVTSQLIEVFERSTGKHLGTIGSVGDEDGQFRLPLGIATDREGNLYVVDMMRCKLQKFTPKGELVWAVGQMGDYVGALARPKHIAVDSDGIVYVVDSAFYNVQMYDQQGRVLMHFGSGGDFPGAMNLPVGVCICEDGLDLVRDLVHPGFDPRRLVVVTNQMGRSKVAVYVMGELREGYTAQDLAAAATSVASGVGAPSAEQLKLQTVNEEELEPQTPTPEGQPAGAKPGDEPTTPAGAAGKPERPR
jgi:DNA-binding beta-propeller fold protein YncE